jgi:AcrR family transcriptional regulator
MSKVNRLRAAETGPFAPVAEEARKPRSDGEQSRERLLLAALRLFGERGFSRTSTRDIAQAAGANAAAISYYFGDKAGLYRAALKESSTGLKQGEREAGCDDIGLFEQPHFTLRRSLEAFFAQQMAPLMHGELGQLCLRLWFREMLEPTGMWDEAMNQSVKPAHAALVRILCRHLERALPDDDVHRLAFSIAGLAYQVMITHDLTAAIRPQLVDGAGAMQQWAASLVMYAEAMVAAEQARAKAGKVSP